MQVGPVLDLVEGYPPASKSRKMPAWLEGLLSVMGFGIIAEGMYFCPLHSCTT